MSKILKNWTLWIGLAFGLGGPRVLVNSTMPFFQYGFVILFLLLSVAIFNMFRLKITTDEYTNSLLLEGLRWSVIGTMVLAGAVMLVWSDNLVLYSTAQGIYFGAVFIFTTAYLYAWWRLK